MLPQIEAEAGAKRTEALAYAIEVHRALTELSDSAAKEIEYVLDLAPKYLWVAGRGSLDAAAHVYEVEMARPTKATFTPRHALPSPPS